MTELTKIEAIDKKVATFGKSGKTRQFSTLEKLGLLDDELHQDSKERKATYREYLITQANPTTTEDTNTEAVTDEPTDADSTNEQTFSDAVITGDIDEVTGGGEEIEPEFHEPSDRMKLIELSDEILTNHRASIYIPEDLPTQKEKRESKYMIGAALKQARNMFASDQQFGEWVVTEINDKLLSDGEAVIPQKTLYNYRKLAEFGSHEECEKIGYTNVYKLTAEGNEDLCSQVRGMLDGTVLPEDSEIPYDCTDVALHVKSVLKPERAKSYTQEELDALLDGYVDEDVFDDMREATQCEITRNVYLDYFGIEPEEFSMDTIKVAHRATAKRFHPDQNGSAYINDFNFANNAFEYLKNLLK